MSWLITLIGFAAGLIVGMVIYRQFRSDEAKVRMLEEQLDSLQREHEAYRDSVHSHFNNTAHLLSSLTESYRDVYKHIATGAQALCPEYISDQLSHNAQDPVSLTRDSFTVAGSGTEDTSQSVEPPRDYAAKTSPDQKGSLAEDYGLDRENDETRDDPENQPQN